jgi:hypothetical protein
VTNFKNILAAIAAFASLFSGLFWHLSAKAALDVSTATATGTASEALNAVRDLTTLSIHYNLWAAYGAAVAGIALAIALALEVNSKKQTCKCACNGNSPSAI